MPSVNLSLPEDLAKELEPYKEKMNLSRIFAEALRREISGLKASADIERTIARLRKQAMDEEEAGYKDGVAFAGGIEFTALDRIVSAAERQAEAAMREVQTDPDDQDLYSWDTALDRAIVQRVGKQAPGIETRSSAYHHSFCTALLKIHSRTKPPVARMRDAKGEYL